LISGEERWGVFLSAPDPLEPLLLRCKKKKKKTTKKLSWNKAQKNLKSARAQRHADHRVFGRRIFFFTFLTHCSTG
jgi:hypothetical protein